MSSGDRDWEKMARRQGDRGFRSLIENAIDIIFVLDENGICQYCSPSAERVLGYHADDLRGRLTSELVHPDDLFTLMTVLCNAIQCPRVSHPSVEYRVRHHDGGWRYFEAVATSLLEDPTIQGVVVNCHDITDRKQVEAALRAANRQIGSILESIADAFISIDRTWQFTYLNQRAAQLFGQCPAEVLRRNLWELFPDFLGTRFEQESHRAIAQQTPIL